MVVAITPTIACLWLFGALGTYKSVRRYSGEHLLADVAGCLFFWWLVLPFVVIRVGIEAGKYYGNLYVEGAKKRREHHALKSGAENGLYDPIEQPSS